MDIPLLESREFAAAVIDALSSQICVIDSEGVIIAVNRAWRDFTADNPPVSTQAGVGTQYLNVCRNATGPGADGADVFASGVQAVLDGTMASFAMEYPCHSPTHNRWFSGQVTPLMIEQRGAVISHITITDRKLLEFDLERLAGTDSLTNLPNRRFFLAAGALELDRVTRFGATASLVMIDLDHFKRVNDTHGHAAGDDALCRLAAACKMRLRQIDLMARLGGEEFVVLLPGTTESGAAGVAEKLRRAVCETQIGSHEHPFTISASFGVAEFRAEDTGIDACLGRADLGLYAAKRTGRNRVVRHSSLPDPTKMPGN